MIEQPTEGKQHSVAIVKIKWPKNIKLKRADFLI